MTVYMIALPAFYIFAPMPESFWGLPLAWQNYYFWEAFEESLAP